jgi:hypothetical protein
MSYLQLVRVAPNGNRKIMNTFGKSGNRQELFFSLPWTKESSADMTKRATQMRAAQEMKDGWERNGPWPDHAFVIEVVGGSVY